MTCAPLPDDGIMDDGRAAFDCTRCGACCVEGGKVNLYWRDDVPDDLVVEDEHGFRFMRRETPGRRCGALCGTVGVQTRCGIYADRPEVCREFVPGGDGCRAARQTMAEWRARLHHKPWGYDERPLDGPRLPAEPRWRMPDGTLAAAS